MNTYFSTFTTGFGDIVRSTLKKSLSNIKIDLLLDGLIVYQTDSQFLDIENLGFLNNTFLLFNWRKKTSDKPFSDMKDWLKNNQISKKLKSVSKKIENLQIIFVEENEYTHLDKIFRNKFVSLVSEKTGIPVVNKDGQSELWLIVRKEGYCLIGLRLTDHPNYEKTLNKGELKPEIAGLLCLMSEPSENDIFIDPFVGSGSIPRVRIKNWPFKIVLASDNDPLLVSNLKASLDHLIKVYEYDALKLVELVGEKSINKIVTDPPWGLFGQKINIGTFYPALLRSFCEILEKNGILVLLVGRHIDLEKILDSFKNKLKLEQKINTLVNGQKATVYKLLRT